MKLLPKIVGDFQADKETSIEEIKELVNRYVKTSDPKELLERQVFVDDITLAHYDYLDGGIGSTCIFLGVTRDDDESEPYFYYGICSELEGRSEFNDELSLEEVDELFDIFIDTLMINTNQFGLARST